MTCRNLVSCSRRWLIMLGCACKSVFLMADASERNCSASCCFFTHSGLNMMHVMEVLHPWQAVYSTHSTSSLHHRLICTLLLAADHRDLLLHIEVRWLSEGRTLLCSSTAGKTGRHTLHAEVTASWLTSAFWATYSNIWSHRWQIWLQGCCGRVLLTEEMKTY